MASLILSAVGISFIHSYFFRNQRLLLIDQQIEEASALLFSSPEFQKAVHDPKRLDEIISKVLVSKRIGKVFVLRDKDGKILSQNFNVALIGVELPTTPEWATAESSNEFVRIQNFRIPGPEKYMFQLGLSLNKNFIDWEVIDKRGYNYIFGIVLILFFASVPLTLFLMQPLRILITHLRSATSRLISHQELEPLPKPLLDFRKSYWGQGDEFSDLIGNVGELMDRININYKMTRSWTAQMAHELKTPLSVMRASLETIAKKNELPVESSRSLVREIDKMSLIIGQFLDWAEIESKQVQKNLYSIKMQVIVREVVDQLKGLSADRIQLETQNEFSVIANPMHLEQMISNLLTNALKFSPGDKKVEVSIQNRRLIVRDYGLGISAKVKARLGEPFNVGTEAQSGNGLGLAWVSSVAKLYGWKFEIRSNSDGTRAQIDFPSEEN